MVSENIISNIQKEIEINLRPKGTCIYCNGTGRMKLKEMVAYLNGGGFSKDSIQTVPCNVCNGTGGR